MCMRVPGRIRPTLILGWYLVLALVCLLPGPAWPRSQKDAVGEPPPASSPPPPSAGPEIIITGKVFTSLKRRVDLPFKGTIAEVLVKSGQKVQAGQILAKYRLAPEALLAIRQRLFPPQISDTEVKLAEVERTLVPLRNRRQELTHLVPKKLASPDSLSQAKREIHLVAREQASLRERLRQERRNLQLDRVLLQQQLGQPVQEQIPTEAALRAPIDGYVIWIHPEMQVDAEMMPTPGVFQVGVMDPMLVRGQAFEIEALQISPGEAAQVTLESLPGRRFQGKVSRISWSSQTPGLDQPSYYDVELRVPNPDLLLKEGLKARIVFQKSP
jgi:multidrug efflux pump subunit AcrA (membrane-fusion protein)